VASPDALGILPGTGFIANGFAGGPFDVTSQNYSLTNSGGTSFTWSILGIPTWLTATPSTGTLAANGSASVSVSLNSAANALSVGTYTATLSFSNQTSHIVQNRGFILNVLSANLVQNPGFEAGLSFISWTVANNDGFTYVDNGTLTHGSISPHSGTNFAALGQSSADGLCTLSQTVTTVPGQIYVLSYWWESVDLGFGTVPNELKVIWNGTTLLDQVNVGVVGWTNRRFNVTATGTSTTLTFQSYDDNAFLVLDDVSVVTAPSPVLSKPTVTAGTLNLNWSTMTGLNYQVQYKTNLTQPSWINLGSLTNAAGSAISFSDSNAVKNVPRRFYRIQMSP
jgi:hypothetical protein